MSGNDLSGERKTLRILFWCFTPLIFIVFLRMFWMLFHFVYGRFFIFLLGKEYEGAVSMIALLTALVFAVGTMKYLYGQFKKHLM
jgi:hypothetical protein